MVSGLVFDIYLFCFDYPPFRNHVRLYIALLWLVFGEYFYVFLICSFNVIDPHTLLKQFAMKSV